MMEQGLMYMKEIYAEYFQNYGFAVLVIVMLLLLQIPFRTRETKRVLGICGIIWILFLNPLVIALVCSMRGAVTGRYVRIFWTFPFIIGIAYLGVRFLEHRNIVSKGLILISAVIILWVTGGPVLTSVYFAAAENPYKIEDEVIEVADRIEVCKKEEWGAPYVLTNVYLSTYLRQYDGNIRQLYGREPVDGIGSDLYGKLYYYADKEIPYDELYQIGLDARSSGIQMIVFAKHQIQSQALEAAGYERVDATEHYYIYRYEG